MFHHNVFHQPFALALYFHPDAGTGTGTATGSAAAGTGTGSDGAAAAGTGTETTGVPAAGADKTFSYKEDRSQWIDPERYKKTEHLVNRTASELERARAVIVERERQIAALTGSRPPSADETEIGRAHV